MSAFKFSILLLSFTVLFSSCKKTNDTIPNENVTLLLKALTIDGDSALFYYNGSNQITSLKTNRFYNWNKKYSYSGDGEILLERSENSLLDFYEATFSNNDSIDIVFKEGYPDSYIMDNFSYEENGSYTINHFVIHRETEFLNSDLVNLILDDNNRVIQYLNTSIENPTDTNYLLKFEYTSGNLTKIYNDTVSWAFSYDNKKNFHTFSSGFSDGIKAYSNSYSDAAGIFWLDKNLSKILRNIPKFYSFLNKNNPEDYSKNGVIYRSLSYSYNENKYPTEMIDEKSGIKIQLEYEKVE